MAAAYPLLDRGSSPRAGRRLRGARARLAALGLIPAGGEATGPDVVADVLEVAHPRGRGGDPCAPCPTGACRGSSPRAGRRPAQRGLGTDGHGLIPAGGEATTSSSSGSRSGRAHPRGRGGDLQQSIGGVDAVGSSPRAGRRRVADQVHDVDLGLIPAGGEATDRGRAVQCLHGAHPRGRGGDLRRVDGLADPAGSSPRAGRRRPVPPQPVRVRGLIPAGGEATVVRVPGGRGGGAHPRGRGGDPVVSCWFETPMGSSPRAGRRLSAPPDEAAGLGLIPAGGEATRVCLEAARRRRAHPRGRGGDLFGR